MENNGKVLKVLKYFICLARNAILNLQIIAKFLTQLCIFSKVSVNVQYAKSHKLCHLISEFMCFWAELLKVLYGLIPK